MKRNQRRPVSLFGLSLNILTDLSRLLKGITGSYVSFSLLSKARFCKTVLNGQKCYVTLKIKIHSSLLFNIFVIPTKNTTYAIIYNLPVYHSLTISI